MESKWFTQESSIFIPFKKKAKKEQQKKKRKKRRDNQQKQLMCIVHSHYIINCHITTNMEISHLKLKLVGCFSPYLPQHKKWRYLSFFPFPKIKQSKKHRTVKRGKEKNISVSICAHEFSLSGTLICWHFRKMMLVYRGVGLSPPSHILYIASIHFGTHTNTKWNWVFQWIFFFDSMLHAMLFVNCDCCFYVHVYTFFGIPFPKKSNNNAVNVWNEQKGKLKIDLKLLTMVV